MLRIIEPTVRDVSYVCANMRAADRAELACQIAPDLDPAKIAFELAMVHAQLSWVVVRNGQPIACFGATPLTYVVWQLWAFGTKHLWRAVPAISKHLYQFGTELMQLGARRLEVRAWKGHDLAPLWLKAVGCTHVTDLSDHGTSGEVFELWQWTASDYLDGSMRARRGNSQHVLLHPQSERSTEASPTAKPH